MMTGNEQTRVPGAKRRAVLGKIVPGRNYMQLLDRVSQRNTESVVRNTVDNT